MIDNEAEVRAAVRLRVIAQLAARVPLVIAVIGIRAAIIQDSANTPLAAGALRKTARRFKGVVAVKIDEEARAEVPTHADAHNGAAVDVVPGVVKQITDRVMASESGAKPLPARFAAPRSVVHRRRRRVTDVVTAEIARDSDAHPVSAAMSEVIVFVGVVAAAVEHKPDSAAGAASNTGSDSLAPAVVARMFRVRVEEVAADVVVVFSVAVDERAESAGRAESLRNKRGAVVVVARAVDVKRESAKSGALRAAEAHIFIVAFFVNENGDASDRAPLADILRKISVVSAVVVPHRHAKHGARLNRVALAGIFVVPFAKVENKEQRPIENARALVIDVVAAKVDNAARFRIFVKFPDGAFRIANENVARFGRDNADDLIVSDTRLFEGVKVDIGKLAQGLFMKERDELFRGVIERGFVHLLHSVDEILTASAAGDRMAALDLSAKDGIRLVHYGGQVVFAHRRDRFRVQRSRLNERGFEKIDRVGRIDGGARGRPFAAGRDVHARTRKPNARENVFGIAHEVVRPHARRFFGAVDGIERILIKSFIPAQTAAVVELVARL